MATLTIFANFYICDEERFLRMKDSFRSFKNIDAVKWVINVRGKFKFDALFFLHDNLGDKLIPYLLESKKGWFHDTQQMLSNINTDYVLLWLEDHVNLTDINEYKEILNELKESDSEYMCYSFWHFSNMRKPYDHIPKIEHKYISTFVLNNVNQRKIRQENLDYIISLLGIFSVPLFKKIITTGLCFLRQWPKFTPLNFEKRSYETRWLPIRYALPKHELFAPIDDGEDGSSLQARGLYPRRAIREVVKTNPVTKPKLFLRSHLRKYVPDSIYDKKVKFGNYLHRLNIYISLLLRGE